MANLIPLFSYERRINRERWYLEIHFSESGTGAKVKEPELFPVDGKSGSCASDEGNYIPQGELGHEWDARVGKWLPGKKVLKLRSALQK